HYLCDVNGFTRDESDCGRTSELALESSNSGLFCRNGSQRVLRHGVSSVLTQIATQGRDLIYGETTVCCDYSCGRVAEQFRQLFHGCSFFSMRHGTPSFVDMPAAQTQKRPVQVHRAQRFLTAKKTQLVYALMFTCAGRSYDELLQFHPFCTDEYNRRSSVGFTLQSSNTELQIGSVEQI